LRRPFVYILITLFFGFAAGGLRALEFQLAWDRELGVMSPGHPASLGLIAVSILFFLLMLPLTRVRSKPTGERVASARHTPTYLTADILATVSLLVSACLDIDRYARLAEAPLSLLVFSLLTVFTSLCMLMLMRMTLRGVVDKAYGFYMTVPVFWSCFWLITEFAENSANPILLSYTYEILAIVFIVLAIYSMAGFFFDMPHTSRTLLYCVMGAFFSCITVLGPLLSYVFWQVWPVEGSANWAQFFRFLYATIHLLAAVYVLRGHKISQRAAAGGGQTAAPAPAEEESGGAL
jgi:hypothetical protein